MASEQPLRLLSDASKASRLSPRCNLNGSSSSLASSLTSRSPFGLSRQASVSSSPCHVVHHGRQSSSTSAELSQYNLAPPVIPPRRPYFMASPTGGTTPALIKLSSPVDQGYQTLLSTSATPPVTTSAAKHSPFDWLSDDLVVQVFKFLPTRGLCECARVCRRFYFLAWEPRLWTKIDLSLKLRCDQALLTLLKLLSRDMLTCRAVERVTLGSSGGLSDAGLEVVASHCPNLRQFQVKNCKSITNSGIQRLLTKCPNLTHLELPGCSLISTTVGLEGQNSLLFLDLSDCTRLMDAGLNLIAKNSPHLRQLFLRRCINITDIGIKYLTSYCLHLKELSISDCSQITDFGLYELAKLGPNLRYLSVAKCDQISDTGVKEIARLCYKLRYLNVRGCEAVSDDAIEVIATSCLRIKSLDIGKCDVTDIGLKQLAEHSTGLRKLSVKSCEMISDKGIESIAYFCRGLQQLNIQDCSITLNAYRVVKKFCKQCIIEHTNPGFF